MKTPPLSVLRSRGPPTPAQKGLLGLFGTNPKDAPAKGAKEVN